jgi:hypothetical protein
MAALCPSWALVRDRGPAIGSPAYLILLCSNVIVTGILLFQLNSAHKRVLSATPYLLVGLGLVAGLASFWRFA